MIGASKILTVSYGTFSCTLEGFDDPFNTMRAIAEYFRDLAAEDRYFGAEPPTPDAAMLHRIAEREVQRRVDAKVQENGVHLRASDGVEPAPAPKASPAVMPAAPAATATAAPSTDEPALHPAAAAAPESIAERLLRLRSEVAAQGQVTPVPQAATTATVSLALPDYVEDSAEESSAPASAMMADFAAEDPAVEEAPSHVVADPSDTLPEDFAADDAAMRDSLPEDAILSAVTEAVAATSASAAPDLPQDTATAAAPSEVMTESSDAASFDAGSFDADLSGTDDMPDAELVSEDLPAPVDAAPVSVGLALAYDADALEAQAAATIPVADTISQDSGEDLVDTAAGITSEVPDFLLDDSVEPEAAADEPAGLDSIFGEADDLPPLQPLPELRPGAAEKLQRARARVYKIRRADADLPPAAAQPEPAQTEPARPAAKAPLSLEAELDLERELAALRAEPASPRAAAHPFGDPSAEDAVSRLMAQADTEMEGEETKRRRSAIAHLKAAVAQTVADRRAGDTKADPEPSRIARYRNDLAMVVRSALPASLQPKPAGERPAPLVLVSEQRIDRPPRPVGGPIPTEATLASAGPVRPRRVTGSGSGLAMQAQALHEENDLDDLDYDLEEALADIEDETLPADDKTAAPQENAFRDYAERLGATSMRDIIEASAAFLICEQKRPHFTRPQMMRHVALIVPQSDSLREDSLRVFGTLLRDGHIIKVRRGQFTLTPASPYHS